MIADPASTDVSNEKRGECTYAAARLSILESIGMYKGRCACSKNKSVSRK